MAQTLSVFEDPQQSTDPQQRDRQSLSQATASRQATQPPGVTHRSRTRRAGHLPHAYGYEEYRDLRRLRDKLKEVFSESGGQENQAEATGPHGALCGLNGHGNGIKDARQAVKREVLWISPRNSQLEWSGGLGAFPHTATSGKAGRGVWRMPSHQRCYQSNLSTTFN